MKYTFTFKQLSEHDGKIRLSRIGEVANHLEAVAKGAITLHLAGISTGKLDKETKRKLESALDGIELVGLQQGSTVLELECPQLGESMHGIQFNLFDNVDIAAHTPVSLAVQAMADATQENGNLDNLDADLLKKIRNMGKLFSSPDEELVIENQGSLKALTFHLKQFQEVAILESETLKPKYEAISGLLDQMKYTAGQVSIKTNEGIVTALFAQEPDLEKARNLWGQKVVAVGKLHYKPSGKPAFIMVEQLHPAGANDDLLSYLSPTQSLEQELTTLVAAKQNLSLHDLLGKWPGEETEDEFMAQLQELD